MVNNKILILGYGGQLSICLKKLQPKSFDCVYFTRKQLDINDSKKILKVLKKIKPKFIINTAALTDVNFCEQNPKQCLVTNAYSVRNLAKYSSQINSFLIHFSSDFVYDGLKKIKYKESDYTNPISVYGKSKLLSEKYIKKYNKKHIIFRVSFIYSNYGNNFYKNVINKIRSSQITKIYKYQITNPTNAIDFAKDIWSIIRYQIQYRQKYGIYNYTSSGKPINRYQFSQNIYSYLNKYEKLSSKLIPIYPTDEYTNIRPKYSSLNIDKITKAFNLKKINHSLSIKTSIKEYYLEYKDLKL